MDIEKLCEEFHEKIGKDKTVKISIEEEAEVLQSGEYLQAEFNFTNSKEYINPYLGLQVRNMLK